MTLIAYKCLGAPLLYCCSPVHRQLTNVMQKPEVQLNQNPINYGAWDTCSSAKAVPINTVMRAKREFVTPAWEREALAKLKEEGRDIASIDKDLKVREGDDGKGNLLSCSCTSSSTQQRDLSIKWSQNLFHSLPIHVHVYACYLSSLYHLTNMIPRASRASGRA